MTTEQNLTHYFEEWCALDPKLPIAKNGDGEYENQITFDFYKCAEYIYKKGVWGGAAQMQKNTQQQSRDENEVVSLMHSAYWGEKGSDTQRMTRVYRELVAAGLLKEQPND